ncbi:cytochrome P450 [Mycobacterium sp. CVI_P3]|uniref:Cytochrome P450 n=1 Tax=Mycobacterium pinniadriaticum TaxID=2994102 RepID=A0ABT3SMY1_9MYCO|nr:cytochrome P450 [Mycobacterium pinniadriaticum]MCX2934473.1 cytochrome P450 [Mycobacterium pinniadriaticum]MCX2940896.1 cytochrome P450 [Mycobacterium pinniadriaticum]
MTSSTERTAASSRIEPSQFHILDPELVADFWPKVNDLRERCPVGWSDQPWSDSDSGYWFINDYADVMAAATNWRAFSSAQGASPVQFNLDILRMIPLETDPPLHREIRKALNPFFTPDALQAREGEIKDIVAGLIDRCLAIAAAGDGTVDFIAEFTQRLPPLVFFVGFLGQKEDELDWIIETLQDLISAPERALELAPRLLMWDAELLEKRRQEGRRDDVPGVIAHLGLDGSDGLELDERQRVETLNLMIMAGMETTMGGIASIALSVAQQPEVRQTLIDGGEQLLDRAADEFLRLEAPVTAAGRTLTKDVEMSGCPMHAGDRIVINWAAANRDPAQFPNPDHLDFERANAASHVAFGGGIHRCLGNHLARREVKAMIRAICALSVFEIPADFKPTFRVSIARGPVSLPVRIAR